jgi:hypothetical protein
MNRIHTALCVQAVVAVLAFGPIVSSAAETLTPWAFELKFGVFEPDLPLYETFYGNSSVQYLAAAFAYQFKDWLELGGELGYMRDSGQGLQISNNQLGGHVKYTLVPAHVFVNFLGRFNETQLFIPYAGAGLTTAFYKQDVESQPNRAGRTDLGFNARVGVQLSLDALVKSTARPVNSSVWFNSYLFLEAQWFTTEVDQQDLGGVAYLGGLRLEFGGSD